MRGQEFAEAESWPKFSLEVELFRVPPAVGPGYHARSTGREQLRGFYEYQHMATGFEVVCLYKINFEYLSEREYHQQLHMQREFDRRYFVFTREHPGGWVEQHKQPYTLTNQCLSDPKYQTQQESLRLVFVQQVIHFVHYHLI